MAKVVTDNQYYTAIANAIRALTGSSDTYTPAQMAPAIISYIAGVDLSDVETYFITDVVNAMKYVKQLGTDDWVHHIVVTDNHFTKNYGHSTAIVKAMQDSGYFSKIINLGDVSDTGSEADYTSAIANYGQFNGDMLFAIGNHDVQVSDYATVFYNAFLSNDTDISDTDVDFTNFNYYWDDDEHQIRYIVYGYHSNMGGATYAVDRIKDAPTGYSVLTLCHYKNQIQSTCLVPIIGHQTNYIGNINGHNHIDSYDVSYGGQYNNTTLSNDGWTNDNASYIKTDGTNLSQAITIMSINTSTRNVKFYRIGMPTTLGQNWQYTYVQGGALEYWEQGYYWNLGYLASSANAYYCTKLFPAVDGEGTAISYRVYSRSGTLTNIYVIGMNASGDFQTGQRLSASVSAVWNRVGFLMKNATGSVPWQQAVVAFLWSINSDGNIASVDDIVITTEHVDLGVAFSNVVWQTGKYINANQADTDEENSVSSYAFDVLPSTTYRFYVDDADWAGTTYLYAFVYYDYSVLARSSASPAFSRRVGANATGSKEFTFTTKSNEYYCRLTARGSLGAVENWESKCHLEVVQ